MTCKVALLLLIVNYEFSSFLYNVIIAYYAYKCFNMKIIRVTTYNKRIVIHFKQVKLLKEKSILKNKKEESFFNQILGLQELFFSCCISFVYYNWGCTSKIDIGYVDILSED